MYEFYVTINTLDINTINSDYNNRQISKVGLTRLKNISQTYNQSRNENK